MLKEIVAQLGLQDVRFAQLEAAAASAAAATPAAASTTDGSAATEELKKSLDAITGRVGRLEVSAKGWLPLTVERADAGREGYTSPLFSST